MSSWCLCEGQAMNSAALDAGQDSRTDAGARLQTPGKESAPPALPKRGGGDSCSFCLGRCLLLLHLRGNCEQRTDFLPSALVAGAGELQATDGGCSGMARCLAALLLVGL